jgi:hypothetical protein
MNDATTPDRELQRIKTRIVSVLALAPHPVREYRVRHIIGPRYDEAVESLIDDQCIRRDGPALGWYDTEWDAGDLPVPKSLEARMIRGAVWDRDNGRCTECDAPINPFTTLRMCRQPGKKGTVDTLRLVCESCYRG